MAGGEGCRDEQRGSSASEVGTVDGTAKKKKKKKECTKTAVVSCGTSHVSAVSTPLQWILKKTCYKKLITHVKSHATAVSLLDSRQ